MIASSTAALGLPNALVQIPWQDKQVVADVRGARMVGTEDTFPNCQGSLQQEPGLRHLALVAEQDAQVIEADRGVRMLGTQDAFPNGQGSLQQEPGLGHLALVAEQDAQVIEADRGVRMLGTQDAFPNGRARSSRSLACATSPWSRSSAPKSLRLTATWGWLDLSSRSRMSSARSNSGLAATRSP